jgi:hypothetical protein
VKLRNPFHGRDHAPGGADPTPTGRWHNVGDPGEHETFITGANLGGTNVPLRLRLAVGPPNVLDQDGSILAYTKHQLEIQGDVTAVSPGDTVFNLRPEYRFEYDLPVAMHDDAGNYVACRLYTDGDFVYGVP